jgi:hypothetical protein
MSAQPQELDFFAAIAQEQAMRKPSQVDANLWAARWLFVPFRDRPLPVDHQQNFGLPFGLKAGYLLPITKFDQLILDNWEVTKVNVDGNGQFMAADEGISRTVPVPRAPARVVQGIFRIFNPNVGDAAQDNGISEVEQLFGVEDMVLVRQIQMHCLPKVYATAREQLAQLEDVGTKNAGDLRWTVATPANPNGRQYDASDVAQRLYRATLQAKANIEWHCVHKVEAAMERPERSGKHELSEYDHACYAWLEKPEPRRLSRLAGDAAQPQIVVQTQAPVATAMPQISCSACGNLVNLLPTGLPPQFCGLCRTPFEKPTAEELQAVTDAGDVTPKTKATDKPKTTK